MKQKKGKWITGPKSTNEANCGECTVVHVDFGGAARRPSKAQEPLSNDELAGLRKVFTMCPLAARAFQEGLT